MSTLIFTWQGVGWGEESNARYCGGWLFLRGFSDCPQVVLWVEVLFPAPLERAGTMACPAGAPFLGKKWGKEPPGEEVPPPGPPSLVGCVGGGCTSYGIPGLRPSQRKARNGPPTGWAGWGRGQVPFGKRRRKTIPFPTFSSRQRTTSPARPSRWAGHEALVLEAAGQANT